MKVRSRRKWFCTKRAFWVKVRGREFLKHSYVAEAQILRLGSPSGRPVSPAVPPLCPEPGSGQHRAVCWQTVYPAPLSTSGHRDPDPRAGVRSCCFLNSLRERKQVLGFWREPAPATHTDLNPTVRGQAGVFGRLLTPGTGRGTMCQLQASSHHLPGQRQRAQWGLPAQRKADPEWQQGETTPLCMVDPDLKGFIALSH